MTTVLKSTFNIAQISLKVSQQAKQLKIKSRHQANSPTKPNHPRTPFTLKQQESILMRLLHFTWPARSRTINLLRGKRAEPHSHGEHPTTHKKHPELQITAPVIISGFPFSLETKGERVFRTTDKIVECNKGPSNCAPIKANRVSNKTGKGTRWLLREEKLRELFWQLCNNWFFYTSAPSFLH